MFVSTSLILIVGGDFRPQYACSMFMLFSITFLVLGFSHSFFFIFVACILFCCCCHSYHSWKLNACEVPLWIDIKKRDPNAQCFYTNAISKRNNNRRLTLYFHFERIYSIVVVAVKKKTLWVRLIGCVPEQPLVHHDDETESRIRTYNKQNSYLLYSYKNIKCRTVCPDITVFLINEDTEHRTEDW